MGHEFDKLEAEQEMLCDYIRDCIDEYDDKNIINKALCKVAKDISEKRVEQIDRVCDSLRTENKTLRKKWDDIFEENLKLASDNLENKGIKEKLEEANRNERSMYELKNKLLREKVELRDKLESTEFLYNKLKLQKDKNKNKKDDCSKENIDFDETIKKLEELVDREYEFIEEETDYGKMPDEVKDSFGKSSITSYCEPEDATWHRDLQGNFYTGIKIGIRNAYKVLKENPELLN